MLKNQVTEQDRADKTPREINKPTSYLAFSDFLFSPPINTPGTIQVNGYIKIPDHNQQKDPSLEAELILKS